MKIKLLYDICHCIHEGETRNICHYSAFIKRAIFKAQKMAKKPIGSEWCSGLKSHKESDKEVNLDVPGYIIELQSSNREKTISYWIPLDLAEEDTKKIIKKKKIIIERFSKKEFLKEIQKY